MSDRITVDIEQLGRAFDALLAEFPDLAEDEDLRRDTLEGETDLDRVLSRMFGVISESEASAAVCKMRMDDLKARAASHERRAEAMRTMMLGLLERLDLTGFKLPEATITVRKGTPRAVMVDETLTPEPFLKVKIEPDKSAIGKALKEGQEVPGWALSNGTPSLTIRTK